jgi:hypothetical protein
MEGADRSVSNHSTTFVQHTPFIQSHGSADSQLHALVDKMGDDAHGADRSLLTGDIELARGSIHMTLHETPGPSRAAIVALTPTAGVTLSPDMDLAVPPGATTPSTRATGEDDPSHGGLEKRNYNFFDELDARLTDLISPEPGSGHGQS